MTNDKYLGRLLKKIDRLKAESDLGLEVAVKQGDAECAARWRNRTEGIKSAEDALLATVAEYLVELSDDD